MKKGQVVRWRCTEFEQSLVEQIANKLKLGQAEAMREIVRLEAARLGLFSEWKAILDNDTALPPERN